METIHSAFKITRAADAAYIPPGRLRRYDLIIFDGVSQIDELVWNDLKAALGELQPAAATGHRQAAITDRPRGAGCQDDSGSHRLEEPQLGSVQ